MKQLVKFLEAETLTAQGTNGVSYAYRRLGPVGARPPVLLQHFRGNLKNWDPGRNRSLSCRIGIDCLNGSVVVEEDH